MIRPVRLAIGAAIAAVLTVLATAVPATAADAGPNPWLPTPGAHTRVFPALPLPAQLSAPYVDVTEVGDLADVAAASGSRYLSLAFLQTATPGSCTLTWAGDSSKPASPDVYGAQLDRIRRHGGDVIPSLGGFTADTTGTELADSCTDVPAIAAALENLVSVYKLHRIDFDIEADSIDNAPAVDRRNQAIAEVEAWACAHRWPLSFSYTLPSSTQGLADSGIAVLASAAKYGAHISDVNLMTFDYWDGAQHDMLADAQTAAAGLVDQLKQTIMPRASLRERWRTVGIVQMNGIDDFGTTEVFSVDQVQPLVRWAARQGVQTLSFWALQRDNGSCPGVVGSNNCSGIAQSDWAFSRAFARFTRR